VTGGRQRALSIIARRRFASPGERFRVHILHVSKTASRPYCPSAIAFIDSRSRQGLSPHIAISLKLSQPCALRLPYRMAGVLLFTIAITPGSISVAIVDLLPGIFRCTPKLPALAVSRLQGNSPRSRLMIAVLFEADALPQAQERYLQLAAGLTPLLSDTPGFIAIERFQSLSTPGKILSLSWWEDEASVANWQQNERHLAAQREGKASIFSYYRIRVARVFRDYASDRGAQSDV
jgi:heme-degrading monooxygenase HmoA